MKIAFIGDIHIDDKTPKFRSDDYCLAIAKKLNWCLEWCRNNEIDKIVLLGDLFHRKEPGGRSRNLIIKILKKHHSFPKTPEILMTIGNHDTGNDMVNFKTTALYMLSQIGYLKITDYDPESKVAFAHHTIELDNELKEKGLDHPHALIWAVHGSIFIQEGQYTVDFNKMNIKGPSELIVCGHLHYAYKAVRSDGRKLINPGSICRNAYTANIKDHKIQMLVVEHNGEAITSQKMIPVAVAAPTDKIFDAAQILLQKNIRKQVQSLITTGDNYDLDSMSLENIFALARKNKISEEVIAIIAKFLGDVNN